MLYVTSDSGRIGPFWWVNSCTTSIHVYNWIYAGSHHVVWRPGVSGWGDPSNKNLTFIIIDRCSDETVTSTC